jgi:quinoprotein dehydrogenase-associated probable ABC transporter substrate-binding protein
MNTPHLKSLQWLMGLAFVAMTTGHATAATPLKVCADPDYMPYSNQAGQGFENKVAELMANALGRPLEYVWSSYRQQGGFDNFLALGLDKDKCDVVMNLPYGDPEEDYTRPYYGSNYVFVYKKSAAYRLADGLDSRVLKTVKLGFENGTPPEGGLKMRDLLLTSTAFDTAEKQNDSPKATLQAVQDGKVNVLITWEPAIGYFMKDFPDLTMAPVPSTNSQGSPERYSFFMSMAVKPKDKTLKHQLDQVIDTHKAQIAEIMNQYNVRMVH